MTLTQALQDAAPTPGAPASELESGLHADDAQIGSAAPEWMLVKLYADLVDDLEHVRIATENRHRALIQAKGLEGSPEEIRLLGMVDSLKKIERAAIRDLERAVKAHPVGGFVESNHGIGLKTMGRLLGVIGDPAYYIDSQTGEIVPRTVSKLWAYCGYKPGQGKRQGQEHEYNHEAKMRAFLIAERCVIIPNSAYRHVYDHGREKYADRDLPDWRKHAMSIRLVAKEILKDLWKYSRGPSSRDTHTENAALNGNGQAQVVGVSQN